MRFQHLFFLMALGLGSCHHPKKTLPPYTPPETAPSTQQAATLPESPAPWLFKLFARPVSLVEYQNAADEFLNLFNTYPESALANAAYQVGFPDELGGQNPVLAWILFREILVRGAKAQGLAVSTGEIQQELENPALLYRLYARLYSPGHPEEFLEILSGQGWTLSAYQEEVRRDLLARKMMASLASQIVVSEEALRAIFVAKETTLTFSYLAVPFAARQGAIKLSVAEITEHLSKNEDTLRASFLASGAAETTVRARHILLKVASDATAAEDKATRQRIVALEARIKAGEDFGTLAEEFSDDSSARRGGDLGWSNPNAYVREFAQAISLLSVGQVSGPVRTQFGYHLVKLEEQKPGQTFDEAKLALATAGASAEKAKALAQKDAEALLVKGKKAKTPSLEALLPKKSDPAMFSVQTATFSLQELNSPASLPEAGAVSPEFKEALLALTSKAPLAPRVVPLGGAYVLLLLTQRGEPDEALFATQREDLLAEERVSQEVAQLVVWIGQRLGDAGASLEINPEVLRGE